jgi:hypothetical protein
MHNPQARPPRRSFKADPVCEWTALIHRVDGPLQANRRKKMASYGSGTIRPLYGVIIRDKCKSSSLETLKAYKVVGNDLLKDNKDKDLEDSLKDLDKAIAAKGKK